MWYLTWHVTIHDQDYSKLDEQLYNMYDVQRNV